MRKHLYLFLLINIYALQGTSQSNSTIDSLLTRLKTAKEDTFKTNLYFHLSEEYVNINAAIADAYADSGLAHAKKINWKYGIAFMYLTKGILLNDAGESSALDYFQKAYEMSLSINDLEGVSQAVSDIGNVYYRQSDYTQAMEWYLKSLQIGEKAKNDITIGAAYANISSLYYTQKNYLKSFEYAQKSLDHFQKTGDQERIALGLSFVGDAYVQLHDTAQAKVFYDRALKIYEAKNNKTGMASLYSQIAVLFYPDYKKINEYQLRSQAIWDEINPTYYNSVVNIGNIGETYFNMVRSDSLKKMTPVERNNLLNKAGEYLDRSITYCRKTNDADNLGYFSNILAEMQEFKGDYKNALVNYKLNWSIKDSLFSQSNKNKIASLESQREVDSRDKQIVINKLALSNQRKQRAGLIIGLILIAVAGTLFYIQSRNRKRTNTTLLQLNNDLDEANKVKAKFFAILSHDLRGPVANLISFLEIQKDAPELISAEDATKYNKNISASAANLLQTMEAMLLWSKEQMQQFKPDIKMIPVSSLFAYLKNFFANSSDVELNFYDANNLSVSTDENYLQTIMHNLTANALKILKDQPGAKIEWKAWAQNGKTFLSITDNGPGLKEEQVAALYNENTAVNGRTGFGLHLIRDLAKTIRCKITMHSDSGNGTTFTLAV
ncbi:MAG: tetratricopeptide repeat-containing sensor histidine kinase [Ferruginibacter sp.]